MIKFPDYFDSLVEKARPRAEKAMVKFPQPNYVLNKVAEESGEVIKAVIHYTEGRETWANVEAELIDNLAMLIRLVKEGDHVIGFTPPAEVQRLNATAQPVSDGWVKCSDRMPELGKPVLVVGLVGNTVQNNVYEWDGMTWSDYRNDYGDVKKDAFTHWMPLPAAPGGQDD
ncbi:DUF551 domain-containing protein [Pantoea ananatis]|uniref:DUF551 domain-containing protein n=1 Tax=Pantoea ananas TaxID=553 RepID=UPI001588DA76|nr:DUF551 domain-containing protein [Pantoea ananatis]MBA4822485.1 DUF551 domain-containing protein [Pantoea ananatis]QKV87666.1 DUF551 domain-containing protein [Pantoea ananatis]